MKKENFTEAAKAAINDWDKEQLALLVTDALNDGLSALEIVHDLLLPTLQQACRDMNSHDLSFPELVLIADTIKSALDVLIPGIRLSQTGRGKGRVVIGTVQGDVHDLGKNLVAAVFESGGYTVIDLGRNVPTEEFIRVAEHEKASVVAASTLMTPTLVNVENLVKEIRRKRLRVKTIVGGWATSPDFAKKIGADAWADDALEGLAKLDLLTAGLSND